jgi:ubiquinone/menaquinone biosynthesis C-methylase UbiE
MPTSKREIQNFFRDQAGRYDWGVWAYRLMGIDEARCRRDTVNALALTPGDTVIDLACGTGLNFPLLQKAVGESGKIIGVDLSPEMLDQARRRVQKAGWRSSTPNSQTGLRPGRRFFRGDGSSRSGSTRNFWRSVRWISSGAI